MNDLEQAARQALEQPKQEPVAWLDKERNIIYMHDTHKTDEYHGFRRTTPLYTEPPQREWVGLKKEDVLYIGLEVEKTLGETPESYFFEFSRAIEAKLKELNT